MRWEGALVEETDNCSRLLRVCFSQKGRTAERGQEVASPHVPLPSQEFADHNLVR
jgi:hypothetical protein